MSWRPPACQYLKQRSSEDLWEEVGTAKGRKRKYIRGKRGIESRNVESIQVGVFHNERLVRWRLY